MVSLTLWFNPHSLEFNREAALDGLGQARWGRGFEGLADGIGGWGLGKGKGMYLNKAQRFGDRNGGICRENKIVFRRKNSSCR